MQCGGADGYLQRILNFLLLQTCHSTQAKCTCTTSTASAYIILCSVLQMRKLSLHKCTSAFIRVSLTVLSPKYTCSANSCLHKDTHICMGVSKVCSSLRKHPWPSWRLVHYHCWIGILLHAQFLHVQSTCTSPFSHKIWVLHKLCGSILSSFKDQIYFYGCSYMQRSRWHALGSLLHLIFCWTCALRLYWIPTSPTRSSKECRLKVRQSPK